SGLGDGVAAPAGHDRPAPRLGGGDPADQRRGGVGDQLGDPGGARGVHDGERRVVGGPGGRWRPVSAYVRRGEGAGRRGVEGQGAAGEGGQVGLCGTRGGQRGRGGDQRRGVETLEQQLERLGRQAVGDQGGHRADAGGGTGQQNVVPVVGLDH